MSAPAANPEVIPPKNNHKRNKWLIAIALIFILIGLAVLVYWLVIGRFHVTTEDAYVAGNQVVLNPEVEGGVVAIYADDTDLVEKGQIVVLLDELPFQIAVAEKTAALGRTVRDVVALFDDVASKEAEVVLKEAELFQAQLDFYNRRGLSESGAISREEYEMSETALIIAEASLESAEKTRDEVKHRIENTTVRTHPFVEQAVADLKSSLLDLIRCRIEAPVTGYVSKRAVQVGMEVKRGDPLLMIVPLYDLWLEANFKETQLGKVRVGQPVSFYADIYGRSVKYHGTVIGFSGGTGSAFALLPAQNASGNWIKIVQRVPVRVSIDPEELCKFPLLIGLSLHVDIDIHDTSGYMLQCQPISCPIYTTSIFCNQESRLEEMNRYVEQIIAENNTLPCRK